jgi:hypothetical protein
MRMTIRPSYVDLPEAISLCMGLGKKLLSSVLPSDFAAPRLLVRLSRRVKARLAQRSDRLTGSPKEQSNWKNS